MNTDRSLIFAYLEEDNVQRAYFRVLPLLTLNGDVREEAIQLWPNEGGLRIVPDRNEQHVFKGRMRTLGAFCAVDLRDLPTEAGKIRTNKNFKPERGEVNQYILYSDTVHELPEHTFYQVLEGAPSAFAALAEKAVTPLFYIRESDTLYGPVRKAEPMLPETARAAAGTLFEIVCPDKITRTILCMDDDHSAVPGEVPAEEPAVEATIETQASETPAEAPAAILPESEAAPLAEAEPNQASVQELSASPEQTLPIGETLHILDEKQGHDDTLKQLDKPVSSSANLLHQKNTFHETASVSPRSEALSGTPLVRTPLRVSVPQSKNHTQAIVNQCIVGKYEPPTQNLPAGTSMRAVSNPVEYACIQLREAWNVSSAHHQLTECILSLEGIRFYLEDKLCDGQTDTIMQRVLRQRLQDLEAERLSALYELDKAKRDVDGYKQELISSMGARIVRETDKLESDRKSIEDRVESLKSELNALTLQRDALQAKVNELQSDMLPAAVAKLMAEVQMSAPIVGIPLHISPIAGKDASLEEMIARLQGICRDSGVGLDKNTAIALLVLLALSPRIGISCGTPAPLATLVQNIVHAFGWESGFAHQIAPEQLPLIGMRTVDSTPALVMTSLPNYAPITGATKLILARSSSNMTHNAAYDVHQWPVLSLPALPFVAEVEAQEVAPVNADSLCKLVKMNTAASADVDQVLSPVLKAATPLSGAAQKELYRFVSVCADLMDGGLPVAVDFGILLWVLPTLERSSKQQAAVKALLNEYPISLGRL